MYIVISASPPLSAFILQTSVSRSRYAQQMAFLGRSSSAQIPLIPKRHNLPFMPPLVCQVRRRRTFKLARRLFPSALQLVVFSQSVLRVYLTHGRLLLTAFSGVFSSSKTGVRVHTLHA